MADKVTAKHEASKFLPHPEGQYVGTCVDIIDMGECVQKFPGTPDYICQKVVLVFVSGKRNDETGDLHDVSPEFTVSMGKKANLRKFLEQWRGRPYTDEQADAGVPLDKLEGQGGIIVVYQKKSAAGRLYALISSIMPLMEGMKAPEIVGYKRAPYWDDKKKQYAAEVAKWRTDNAPPAAGSSGEFDDFPPPLEDDPENDLPF